MPIAGIAMTFMISMPEVSKPAVSIFPNKMSFKKMEPKPTGIHI